MSFQLAQTSSNPTLGAMKQAAGTVNFGGLEQAATMSGTTTKALALVCITMLVGVLSMEHASNGLMIGSCLAAVVVGFITAFKPNFAPITAPIYAVLEGLALGSISGFAEMYYPGIAGTAILATFVITAVMLGLWKAKVIVATEKFKSVVTSCMIGIMVFYLVRFVLGFFFDMSFFHEFNLINVGLSVFIIGIAALTLILDFDAIETSVNQGLPKYFEYYNAYSLLVTICWLYVEILRLLMIIYSATRDE